MLGVSHKTVSHQLSVVASLRLSGPNFNSAIRPKDLLGMVPTVDRRDASTVSRKSLKKSRKKYLLRANRAPADAPGTLPVARASAFLLHHAYHFRFGSWLCKNDFGAPSSATLIQADSGSRTKDSRGTRTGFLYCVAAAVFGVFTQPGSFATNVAEAIRPCASAAPVKQTRTYRFFVNHSCSFDHRRRPDTFRTAIATAFFCPTITTSFLPRVTPV